MKINYKQFLERYNTPAKSYFIEIYNNLDKNDFLRLCEVVRYHCNRDGVSYILGFSTTNAKTAKSVYQRTGKRGRPTKIIVGRKVNGHCHNIFIGTKRKSCWTTVSKIAKAINRKSGKRITKIRTISNGIDVYDYTGYILKQSDTIRSGGSFDFKEFYRKNLC